MPRKILAATNLYFIETEQDLKENLSYLKAEYPQLYKTVKTILEERETFGQAIEFILLKYAVNIEQAQKAGLTKMKLPALIDDLCLHLLSQNEGMADLSEGDGYKYEVLAQFADMAGTLVKHNIHPQVILSQSHIYLARFNKIGEYYNSDYFKIIFSTYNELLKDHIDLAEFIYLFFDRFLYKALSSLASKSIKVNNALALLEDYCSRIYKIFTRTPVTAHLDLMLDLQDALELPSIETFNNSLKIFEKQA